MVGLVLVFGRPTPPKKIARKPDVRSKILVKPVGLDFARTRYVQRGMKYSLGNNDCSTFVTDYLKGARVPLQRRLTTSLLYRPWREPVTGLRLTYSAQPGDVVVYRYGKGEGHCGVIAKLGDELIVYHNARSAGGLTIDYYSAWIADARTKPGAKPVRVLRLPNNAVRVAQR
jgi:cell wall-associated NlpC family hydrolase